LTGSLLIASIIELGLSRGKSRIGEASTLAAVALLVRDDGLQFSVHGAQATRDVPMRPSRGWQVETRGKTLFPMLH
jgi:hypothetical protein